MTTPPRMLLLDAGASGGEAFVTMPTTFDKALQAAMEKFNIPKDTHVVRLACNATEMPYIGGYAGTTEIFITDNDSYHYACAGKHVARLMVHVYEKNPQPKAAPKAPSGGGEAKKDGGGEAKKDGGGEKEKKGGSSGGGGGGGSGKTADIFLDCKKTDGKQATLVGTVTGDLAKGPPAGAADQPAQTTWGHSPLPRATFAYCPQAAVSVLSNMTKANTFHQKFVGQQLGPNEVITKYVIHDKGTARLLFRPRSIRPQIDILYPEEKSLEVSMSVADWQVLAAYPMTSLLPDNGRQRLRWFLRVKPGGLVEDLLTGTEASGLFVELLPSPKPRPEAAPGPEDPLVPAWPDVRPQNAWCLPQSIFIPHIDRVLGMLGLPVESRTNMITSWLPSITRHKNIAYRILTPAQLAPSTTLNIIPPPQVLLRIFVLFRGILEGDMKEWADRGVVHAEMGLDWRGSVGWSPDMQNEELFRIIEYGAMEVFD